MPTWAASVPVFVAVIVLSFLATAFSAGSLVLTARALLVRDVKGARTHATRGLAALGATAILWFVVPFLPPNIRVTGLVITGIMFFGLCIMATIDGLAQEEFGEGKKCG